MDGSPALGEGCEVDGAATLRGRRAAHLSAAVPTSHENSGTNSSASEVAASIPPMTPVPMECRLNSTPRPRRSSSGTAPRMKASEVITIGRSRGLRGLDGGVGVRRALPRASAPRTRRSGWRSSPPARSASSGRSGSTRRSASPRSRIAISAPKMRERHRESARRSGSDHDSYCAARIRNTMTQAEHEHDGGGVAGLLLLDRPRRSTRSCSPRAAPRAATSSMAASAWPEAVAGRGVAGDLGGREVVEARDAGPRPAT